MTISPPQTGQSGLRVLVCGGRDFDGKAQVFAALNNTLRSYRSSEILIIHGGARGADSLAADYARSRHLSEKVFRADWHRDGRSGGPIRNQRMIDEGKPDLVIAFPGGRGTADMVRRARAAGIEVVEVGGK